eukprot:s1162_g13.t1
MDGDEFDCLALLETDDPDPLHAEPNPVSDPLNAEPNQVYDVLDLFSLLETDEPDPLHAEPNPVSDPLHAEPSPVFDFLSFLETDDSDPMHVEQSPVLDVVAVAETSQAASEPAATPDVEPEQVRKASDLALPSMVGKVGAGRHGEGLEPKLLTMHMRHVKMLRRARGFQDDVSDLLADSCFVRDGKLVAVRAKPTTTGLRLTLERKAARGNRYSRVVPWSTFFQASYGKLIHSSHMAISLNVSRSMCNFMTNMVGCVYMAQQMILLSKLIHFSAENPPKILIHQLKWDETGLLCTVDADKSGKRVRSSWETMVARSRIVLVLESGASFVFRLVLPPIVLLSSGAHDIFYGLFHHPTYLGMMRLLNILMGYCQQRIQVLESDAASANLRLFAHLIQRNQQSDLRRKFRMIHVLCQNHQSQLINVTMLGHIGSNLLNRLYGMTTFIRNLGYFMRLRQGVYDWLDKNLIFEQRVMGIPLCDHVTPNPVFVQLVDYLRQGRKMHSEDDLEQELSSVSFEKKASFFLEMFNSTDSCGNPCHVCSHSALPESHRHCTDRRQAIQKCADALIGLSLGAMPSIPTPNKWTTLFGPMSFALSGILVHEWLPHLFFSAFKDMKFSEFEKVEETADPRLVETLSFHAVTCRNIVGRNCMGLDGN